MAETFDHRVLAALVQMQLNTTEAHLTPIRTGKHNSSFWVDTPHQRFVLRLAPPDHTGLLFYERRMMRQEPTLHELIRARTALPVAEVIAYDFSRSSIDRDYVLLSALAGMPLSEVENLTPSQIDDVLEQVGRYLSELHSLTAIDCLGVRAYGYLGEHRPMELQPSWFAAFRLMWHMLLDDVVACGTYSATEARALRALLDRHREHFLHPIQPRLLHMDIWAQNILVDATGTVTGLVDFDRALWGDIEIEFAVLDYCGISEPGFWRGYGAVREMSASAQIRRLFYLLYEVQKYMPIRIWRGNDPSGAAQVRAHSLAIAAQLGYEEPR
jgi:aminoglycoside phosphotransferase (APT) family kinase protein